MIKHLFIIFFMMGFKSAYANSDEKNYCSAKTQTQNGRYSGCNVLIQGKALKKLPITSAERCENYCKSYWSLLTMEVALFGVSVHLTHKEINRARQQPMCIRSQAINDSTGEFSYCKIEDNLPLGGTYTRQIPNFQINRESCKNYCSLTVGEVYPQDKRAYEALIKHQADRIDKILPSEEHETVE